MSLDDKLVSQIRRNLKGMDILENEPMSAHTSFRIGGPARVMLVPRTQMHAAQACRLLRALDARPFILGRGTNLLVADEGIDQVVIKIGEGMDMMARPSENVVSAGAGVSLARLAQFAQGERLSGLEFAHGIPGSLGGAVFMNAGAYGGEMKDVVRSVTYIDEDLELREASAEDCGFSYRHSVFSDTERVILSARLELTPGDPEEIGTKMRELGDKRRASQPLELPSAGSTFRRPEGAFAAALIDQAGLKGFAIGGAQVSEKHAGFVVNRGGATCGDVLRLMDHIRETVFRASGVMLEPQVRIVR